MRAAVKGNKSMADTNPNRAPAHVLPLADRNGAPFRFRLDWHRDLQLYRLDAMLAGGGAAFAAHAAEPANANARMARATFENAVASAWLAGAAIDRASAKAMLRIRRVPSAGDESAVLNNFRAAEFAVDRGDDDLSVDMLLRLHRVLARGRVPDADAGRFRLKGDGWPDAPPPHTIPSRAAEIVAFANSAADAAPDFRRATRRPLSPLAKAAVLHFAVVYNRLFGSANAEAARVLFDWSLLRARPRLPAARCISISAAFQRQWPRYESHVAFRATGADGDISRALHLTLNVAQVALDDMEASLERLDAERRRAGGLVENVVDVRAFNDRQRELVAHVLRHPAARYTVEGHRFSNHGAADDARDDLELLVEARLLRRSGVAEYEVDPDGIAVDETRYRWKPRLPLEPPPFGDDPLLDPDPPEAA